MPYEVVNTSSERGLVPGQAGYCDVLRTEGTPEAVCVRLGPMSRYDETLSGGQAAWAVRTIRHGGMAWGVVTCTVPCGLDYTGRQNRLAHHIVVAPSELAEVNPAAVLAWFVFRSRPETEPHFVATMPELPSQDLREDLWCGAGMAGWDRALAREIEADDARHLLLLPADAPVRGLLAALLQRIAPQRRWTVGLCSGSDAATAGVEGVRIRVLVGAAQASGPEWEPWPGERLHDLRLRPPMAVPVEGVPREPAATPPVSSPGRRVRIAAAPPPIATPAGTRPIDIDLGGAKRPIDIDLSRRPKGAPEHAVHAVPRRSGGSGIVWVWLAAGVLTGMVTALVLFGVLRHGS